MTGSEIEALFDRLGRLVSATRDNAGNGTAWDFTFPNGEVHRYVIRGLRSHAEAEDSALNLLIWIWNAKDYLKKRAVARGRDAQVVEDRVNRDIGLAMCGDLANLIKHGGRDRRSRSELDPRLGKVCFSAPQTAVKSLTFRPFEVEVQIDDPSQVEFRLPVLDDRGNKMGDAFSYARSAIRSLERLRDDLERAGASS